MLPPPIKKFIEIFSSLPAIGPRQAHRLAFYIRSLGNKRIQEISDTVKNLENVSVCEQCFFTHGASPVYPPKLAERREKFYPEISEETQTEESSLCFICSNSDRDTSTVAIIEKETDLISLEKTKKFFGRYLILGDLKKDGFLNDEQKRRLDSLRKSANKKFKEIIIALSPTIYGDINAQTILSELNGVAVKVTRLGRGIPTGGEIEFADEETLGSALDNRG
jgi:recombination protein RecR